jgi:hypothetical protein
MTRTRGHNTHSWMNLQVEWIHCKSMLVHLKNHDWYRLDNKTIYVHIPLIFLQIENNTNVCALDYPTQQE